MWFSHRSNACPDCRAYITGTKRVYLNLSHDEGAPDEPISEAAWTATINGLTERIAQYETEISQLETDLGNHQTVIIVLRMQSEQRQAHVKQLERTDRERKRKLVALNRELDEQKASAKTELVQLSAALTEKEQTIRQLESYLKSMETKNEHKIRKIHNEYAVLNEKMARMNKCIDALNIRPHFDDLMDRRVTRSQTQQRKIKAQLLLSERQRWTNDGIEQFEANSIAIVKYYIYIWNLLWMWLCQSKIECVDCEAIWLLENQMASGALMNRNC